MSKKSALFIISILVLLLAGSGVLFLPLPFTRDQGIYAYLGWCWLGEWYPYQYAFGHKGPWLYLIYAISLQLSRGAGWGVNLADLLSRGLSLILLFIFAEKIFGRKKALLGAFLFFLPLFSIFSSCWWNAQAETFMMPLAILVVVFALLSWEEKGFLKGLIFCFLSGLGASQLLMFKPSSFWLGLGIFLFLLIFLRDKKTIFSFLFGAGLGIIIWLIYFWIRGIGREFFEEVILFNLVHLQASRGDCSELGKIFLKRLWLIFSAGIFLLPAGIYLASKKIKEPELALTFIWFLASFLELLIQFRFFLYHFILLLAPFSLILLLGWEASRKRSWRILYLLVVLFWSASSFRFYILLQRHYQTYSYLRGKISQGEFYSRFAEPREGKKKDFNLYASWVVADYIRKHTGAGDFVLVFGYEPGINYLSARRAPSRFHSDYPLTFEPKNRWAENLQKRWRKIFLNDLNQNPPRLVILVHNDINALEKIDSYHQAKNFKEFWSWLNQNYQAKERIEDFQFFWRKENG